MAEMEGSTSVGEEVSTDMAIASPSVSDSGGSDNSEKSEEELFEVERIVGLSKIRVSASAFPLCEMQCMHVYKEKQVPLAVCENLYTYLIRSTSRA